MGEKDAAKSEGEKKGDAGGKKDDGPIVVVLKFDMHCEGCAKKLKKVIGHFDGVEDVKADSATNKLTVTGKVDPARLRERVEEKIKKKVELVSPQPKKDGGGGDKKSDDKKAEDKKPKEPQVSTVVLKIQLHCDGCAKKIKRIIIKIDGVESVTVDEKKDLVTVKGTMDAKVLAPFLKEKLRRNVEVVPPAKKDDGGGEKKEKEGGGEKKEKGGDGEKKDSEAKASSSGGDGSKSVEVNKMEYHGYHPQYSYYSVPAYNQGHVTEYYGHTPMYAPPYAQPYYQNNAVEYSHAPPPPPYLPAPQPWHAPQMFSDENPNACSVM
ncbi:hypothetical protein F0562_016923 [Nyssa sinensis]|uniref:HMA domain-containing protein n=1 Tax=Nyssa sinensis TaxID=561372 RepID=A0A5J4ZGV9_9ASTE|nr:hypothetical protein F0562_016923 [Nyssa sinensis]